MAIRFTRYKDALDYIFGLNKKRKVLWEFGFERMQAVLEEFENPQDAINTVHVAGTKGKGSTISFLSFILRQKNNVGLFTSPSLVNTNERISINGVLIPPNEFIDILNSLLPIYNNLSPDLVPTTFETFAIIAFLYFKRKNVDISLFEVGMGGRLDATNIIKHSLVSVITPISFDHQKILGDTLSKIAFEKAGIIKENGVVVIGKQEDEAKEVILNVAKSKNAKSIIYGKDFRIENVLQHSNKTVFDFVSQYSGLSIRHVEIPLLGKHQAENASISIQSALLLREQGHNVSEKDIKTGLKKSFWPGRMEVVKKEPLVMLDGAHNGASARALKNALNTFGKKRTIFLFGILKDKNVETVLSVLSEIDNSYFVLTEVPFSGKRRLDVLQLKKYAEEFVPKKHIFYFQNFLKAYEFALRMANKDDLICVTGSLYLVSSVRKLTNHFVFSFNIL
jgi:dihydrofolate synthase/folylpolyglutamate synthase